jgi:hypothetical protein
MNTDPIIAALRKQQRLYDTFISAADTDQGPAAAAAYNAAFDELLRTRPRTRAGAAALIRHCLAEDARFPTKAEGGDAVTLLRTLANAMPALTD